MEIKKYYNTYQETIESMDIANINLAIEKIRQTIDNGNWVFTCGNGGSATTASHYATDWGKMRWVNKKKQFKVACLADNVGMLTAYGNDISYDSVFAESLSNYGSSGDLLILVSGSGNSKNMLEAATRAKELNINTISLVGYDGGMLKEMCDISVHYPVNDMQISEDLHLSFGHLVMKHICI